MLAFLCCWAWGVFWMVRASGTTKTGQWTWALPASLPSTMPPSPSIAPPSSSIAPPSPATPSSSTTLSSSTTPPSGLSPPSRFLYLLQTESCLHDSLRSAGAFGSATACDCDVVVLSYKQTCNDPPPAHVEYISASSPTSWNEGRNLLYGIAMKRKEKYLYYIFMDGDIILTTKAKRNPWRLFEDFLRRIEPAVGAVDTNRNRCVLRTYKARKLQRCSLNGKQEYIPAVHYDAAFNAFHYQAVDYILPYPLKFDHISWRHSQWYVIIKSKVIFPRQVVLHTGLLALNKDHHPYPRKPVSTQDLQNIVRIVQTDLPRKYQNTSMLLEWMEYGEQHEKKSPVTCLPPPPPHMSIKPFAYMEAMKH